MIRLTSWGKLWFGVPLAAVVIHAFADEPAFDQIATDALTTELPELVVTAERTGFTGKTGFSQDGLNFSLDAEEISRLGIQDLGNITKYDPLVSAPFDIGGGDGAFGYGGSGYAGFNIRGAEGNRIAIELDGIRQPPQYISTSFDQGTNGGSGGVGRDYFDPSVFSLVEILKSGNSTLYGSDSLGGVVNLQTLSAPDILDGKDLGALLSGQYFSVNDSVAGQVAGATRQGDFEMMLFYSGRHGHETINNGDIAPNPVDFNSDAVLAKAGYVHGEHAIRLTAELYQRDTFTDAISATTSDFTIFDKSVRNDEEITRKRVSLEWAFEPQDDYLDRIENHLYYQTAESHSVNDSSSYPVTIGGVTIPGRVRHQTIDFTTDLFGYNGFVHKTLTTGDITHRLMGGVELSSEDSRNRFMRDDTGMPYEKDRISFAPATTGRYGVFLIDEIRPATDWTVTPGLRLDYNEIDVSLNNSYLARLQELDGSAVMPAEGYDNLTLSPRLDLAWQATQVIRVYANYARGVRNPTAEELTMIFDHPSSAGNPAGSVTIPNPNLEEETSDSFTLGAGAQSEMGKVDLSGFYTFYHNYIENSVFTGRQDDQGRDILTTLNRGESEIFGFEADAEWNASSWQSRLQGFRLGVSTGKAVGISRTDDVWLNTTEPWKTVGWLSYDDASGRFGGRLTGIYTAAVTQVDDTTDQGEFFRPPSWFTLDLTAWWKPTDTTTISAGVNNIFDEKYYVWSNIRRGGGHLGGNAVDDRSTAPGTNFFLSLTQTF